MFQHPRLHECAAEIRHLVAANPAHVTIGNRILPGKDQVGTLPLSYGQQRLWFLWQLDSASSAYHIQYAIRLSGRLDEQALYAGFQNLIKRHESLRTIFRISTAGATEQVIQPVLPLVITDIDLQDLAAPQREQRATEEAKHIIAAPFDLTQGPLLRVALIRMAEHENIVVIVMHHIISDGASMQILLDEFAAHYQAHQQEKSACLNDLPIRYTDYTMWQRNWLETGEKERQLAYWRSHLGEEHPVLMFPTDYPRQPVTSYRAAQYRCDLPENTLKKLRQLALDRSATLFMTLLTGFQVLLHRYTGHSDIRVGVPIANRHRVEIENLVGFFVNTQVLRNGIDGRIPLSAILDQAREAALGAQTYQDLPFEQLVEALQPERSLNQNPLFQVMFNHLREDYRALEQLPGLTIEKYELGEQGTQFELTLDTLERPDGRIDARFTYAVELFDADTIQRLGEHYLQVLEQLAEHPQQCVGDIPLLSAAEWEQLKDWGVNEKRYANQEPVHRLIERQAAERPDAIALIFGDTKLSYAELNVRANHLAYQLIVLGVKPESRVGIALERSIEMIVGLLATLKAGGAYVPLDPDYPRERLDHMVTDSAIELLLTQSHIKERIPQIEGCQVLELDTLDLTDWPPSNPRVNLHSKHLAYIIYTSGSTGKPKGVGVAHHALAEHAQIAADAFNLNPEDRILQFSTINFDAFVDQLFPALCVGAGVVLRGSELWDSKTFYRELFDKQITVADLTTAYWLVLISDFEKLGLHNYGALRQINVGGEKMPPEAIHTWRAAGLSAVTLLNVYGPTEAVVTATLSDCGNSLAAGDVALRPVAIGKPLPARRVYLLDENLVPVVSGVLGELYIGGELLARGYLNNPGLTAERFVADPFDERGGRLYRTGDLARWRRDGQIEYLGRLDHQVKVRGFRIELGEIEAQLLLQPEIREAVVVAREGPGGTRLIAYVSLHAGNVVDAVELRGVLTKSLPDYMIPSAIVVLEHLPLDANGKVDRKLLPEPELISADYYEAPQGEMEEALAAIWAEILGIPQVGRNDNFFELGGDSILSLQIVTKARRASWRITPRQLFERQTVAALAPLVKPIETVTKITQDFNIAPDGPIGMLPIQLDFFAQDIPMRQHWNQAVFLKSRQPLDAKWLDQALQAIVQHHHALRFCYREQTNHQWEQIATESIAQDVLWVRDAADTEQLSVLCNAAQRSLNLHEGPLIRVLLVNMADQSQRLLLIVHHLVIDGVSWRILVEDLETAYFQAKNHQTIVLPETTTDYPVWTHRLLQYAQHYANEFTHWQNLANVPATLPCDFPQGDNNALHHTRISVKLDQTQTQALLKDAPAAYRTQVNDILLTALASALCQWSGHEKILVDLEGHGREDLYADIDLSRTIGWFTSLFPVILDPSGDLSQRIKHIKESLRQIPHKGLGYGLFRYYGTEAQRQVLASLPKTQVVFNYLGQFDASFGKKPPGHWPTSQWVI